MIGERLSHFTIEQQLGSGGMGQVFRATDIKLKRQVAIKRLHPELARDPDYRRRFLREAQHAASFNHMSIASIYDILEIQGDLYLIMEYVDGAPLQQWSFAEGGLKQFLSIAVQCAEALEAAHAKGVIHRDIKPGNILLTLSQQVKVLDFGLARRISPPSFLSSRDETPREQGTCGTPAYMAPEVIRGCVGDARSDIFSLGVVLYELLTGRHPFMDKNLAATVNRVLTNDPPSADKLNRRAPNELSRVISKMLKKDREQRYLKATDVVADLRRIERESGFLPSTSLSSPPGTRLVERRHLYIWSSAALIVTIVVSSGILNRWYRFEDIPENSTLVVTPLVAETEQADLEDFCVGLGELLSSNLSRLASQYPFKVIPSETVRKTAVVSDQELPSKLGATLTLNSSLVPDRSQLKVLLTLSDADSGRTLKHAQIVGSSADPLALLTDLTRATLTMLDVENVDPASQLIHPGLGTETESQILFFQGLGHFVREQWEEAVEDLRQALTFESSPTAAEMTLAQAYARMNCQKLSLSTYLKALERGGGTAVTSRTATALFYLGRHREALEYARRAIQLSEQDDREVVGFNDLGSLASILYWAGRSERDQAMDTYRKALERVEAYLETSPGDTTALESRALYMSMLGDQKKGREEIDQLLQTGRESSSTWYKAAIIYQLSGNTEKAAAYLLRSLELEREAHRAAHEPAFEGSPTLRAVVAKFPNTPCPLGAEM